MGDLRKADIVPEARIWTFVITFAEMDASDDLIKLCYIPFGDRRPVRVWERICLKGMANIIAGICPIWLTLSSTTLLKNLQQGVPTALFFSQSRLLFRCTQLSCIYPFEKFFVQAVQARTRLGHGRQYLLQHHVAVGA